ncbi:MAG: 16S rRNA (cytosine(1402)-N(4))-methyltransferase RsmH [Lachnospiraceae bacterium]|nr:16S rRNA (cytosine(1402)-N(4))-methyltransferase RsmH [Lachnospiraceae bacterium]
MAFAHKSVLLQEVIDGLAIRPAGVYVDATLGGGGHAYQLCTHLQQGKLIGIDQDESAIQAATERLRIFGDMVTIVRSNYCDIKNIVTGLEINQVDGIVLDLGVSSHQLDTSERGFSYRFDAPLDMRMDQRQVTTAKDIINQYSEKEIFRVIRDYGEDRFAQNIAKHIVRDRARGEIATTEQLNAIIKKAIPMKFQKTAGHPSKRTFQAVRIELNKELEVLRNTLDDMIDLLTPGGRICVITFHSLEDKIVKSAFKKEENPCICPSNFPVCVCGNVAKGKVVTRKPILPSVTEIAENSRAKSAKLRIFERM